MRQLYGYQSFGQIADGKMELKRFNAFAVRCTFAECKLEEKESIKAQYT